MERDKLSGSGNIEVSQNQDLKAPETSSSGSVFTRVLKLFYPTPTLKELVVLQEEKMRKERYREID